MPELLNRILKGQYEAALCMMKQCLAACPAEHWEDKIANGSFRWVAYHTLFFTDLYLTRNEKEFVLRDLHERGGDERGPNLTPGLGKEDALAYVAICHQKVLDAIPKETDEILQGESGFSWRKFTRAEMHIYNIRHIQHHTGQLSAFLRRIGVVTEQRALPWIGTGWR